MPINGDEAAVVEARLDVWLMPEMTFPCTLVAVPLLAAARSMPRNSFDQPVMVVVPLPLAAPKPVTLLRVVWGLVFVPVPVAARNPMTLLRIVWALPFAPVVLTRLMPV